jgi:hypothetical protein
MPAHSAQPLGSGICQGAHANRLLGWCAMDAHPAVVPSVNHGSVHDGDEVGCMRSRYLGRGYRARVGLEPETAEQESGPATIAVSAIVGGVHSCQIVR